MRLDFEIRLESDYHIASGYGIGESVDSALARDPDGQPVIRGSAIAGLLRDAMRRLLVANPVLKTHVQAHLALEDERRKQNLPTVSVYCSDEACPLCRILGTPARPKPWTFGSARPVDVPDPVIAEGRPAGNPVTRVRVDPLLRRALDGHLFTQEEGGAALVFRFTARCDEVYSGARRDAALLVAAARMVRHLGNARRRGRGACLWSLVGSDLDWPARGDGGDRDASAAALGDFERWWLNGEPNETPEAMSAPYVPRPPSGGAPVRLQVIVRADEPILVAERPLAGNLFQGLGHISGSTLWGALAACAASRLGLRDDGCDPAAHGIFADLFFGGRLRASPLYPAEAAAPEADLWLRFPAPLDLLTCKHVPGFSSEQRPRGHDAVHAAVRKDPPSDCATCGGPLESLSGLLTLEERAGLETAEIPMQEEMHPRIDPETGQVSRGDLFGYRALAAGQHFVGELWLRDAATLDAVLELAGLSALQRLDGAEPERCARWRLGWRPGSG